MEYDATAFGDVDTARWRIERIVDRLRPTGAVLEIVCGAGMWTAALARHTTTLTATDAPPETIELASARVSAPTVTSDVADVFVCSTTTRLDVIFFSAWLSHMPTDRFGQFWASLGLALARGAGAVRRRARRRARQES